jgi:hypothetical protein
MINSKRMNVPARRKREGGIFPGYTSKTRQRKAKPVITINAGRKVRIDHP